MSGMIDTPSTPSENSFPAQKGPGKRGTEVCFVIFLVSLQILAISSGANASTCADLGKKCRPCELLAMLNSVRWNPPKFTIGLPESWPKDGPVSADGNYESSFAIAINSIGIEQHYGFFRRRFNSRNTQGRTNHVLDLFGSGFFVADPNIVSSLTGVRLGPYPREELQQPWISHPPTEIFGDIFEMSTWQNLDKSMKLRGINKFDLITMRPVGGWGESNFHNSRTNALALHFILLNVTERLAGDGVFFFQILGFIPEAVLQSIVQEIELTTPYQLRVFTDFSLQPTVTGVLKIRD